MRPPSTYIKTVQNHLANEIFRLEFLLCRVLYHAELTLTVGEQPLSWQQGAEAAYPVFQDLMHKRMGRNVSQAIRTACTVSPSVFAA